MITTWLLWTMATIGGDPSAPVGGNIVGVARNGTRQEVPLVDAEIVLRASRGGSWAVVGATKSDSLGAFSFSGLDAAPQTVYQAGVNWQGIHYPGPRVQFRQGRGTAEVQLVAFDAIESPSPLICRRHAIDVRPQIGYCEVSETLLVENPTNTTYVGESSEDHPTVTLKIELPTGVEKVTFEKEFHGRNFQFTPKGLATQLPWKPGSQEIRFLYRVPTPESRASLLRPLPLPTEQVSIEVTPERSSWTRGDSVLCSLDSVPAREPLETKSSSAESPSAESLPPIEPVRFIHSGSVLAAGHPLEIRWNVARWPWETWARWGATALAPLIVGGLALLGWRRSKRSATAGEPSGADGREAPRARGGALPNGAKSNANTNTNTKIPPPSSRFLKLHRRRRAAEDATSSGPKKRTP